MPKNPVKAARQAGRAAVKSARQEVRASKVAAKYAEKVNRIAGNTTSKPAAKSVEAPVEKLKGREMTKIQSKTGAGPSPSTPRSMSEIAKKMKTVKAASSKSSSSSSKPKTKTAPAPVKQDNSNMFLQPGENYNDTLPWASSETKKRLAAEQAKAILENAQKRLMRGSGTGGGSSDRSGIYAGDYGPKYKKGGSVKRKTTKK